MTDTSSPKSLYNDRFVLIESSPSSFSRSSWLLLLLLQFTMALRPTIFLLASLLAVTTRVSSTDEELLMEAKFPVPSPAHSPMKVLPPPPPPQFPITSPPPVPTVKPPALPPPPVKQPVKPPIECTPLCVERCKLHSRKNLCLRVCVTCCNRCKCVPPGTYGNREKCGECYTNMTTRGGKPKCP